MDKGFENMALGLIGRGGIVTNKYGAIATGEKSYRVAILRPNGNWYPLFDIKEFDNFLEADNIAREVANGQHQYNAGLYINMR